jgi:hypothetical protein
MKNKSVIIFILLTAIVFIVAFNFANTNKNQPQHPLGSINTIEKVTPELGKLASEFKKAEWKLDNPALSETEGKRQYGLLCTDLKNKYFSNDDEMIDPSIEIYSDVLSVENKLEMMSIIAHKIATRGPNATKLCLVEEYYKYTTTLLDALKSKKINSKQKNRVALYIIRGAEEFANGATTLSLSLVRELIDRKFIGDEFLYESKDYMERFDDYHDALELGKISKKNLEIEKDKLSEDVSSLLLSIQRSLQ